MTRAHRIAHRGIFVVMAVAIPALLAAGIGLRPRVPPLSEDEALFIDNGFAPADVWAEVGMETEIGIDGLRFALATDADGRALTIRPLEIIARPDLLVYWSARETGPGDDAAGDDVVARLDDALLVGSLSGRSRRVLTLPAQAEGGNLLVYSLGYGELLADLPLRDLPPARLEATPTQTTATE